MVSSRLKLKFSDKLSPPQTLLFTILGVWRWSRWLPAPPTRSTSRAPKTTPSRSSTATLAGSQSHFATERWEKSGVKEGKWILDFSESPELVSELLPGRGCGVHERGVQSKEKLLHPVWSLQHWQRPLPRHWEVPGGPLQMCAKSR